MFPDSFGSFSLSAAQPIPSSWPPLLLSLPGFFQYLSCPPILWFHRYLSFFHACHQRNPNSSIAVQANERSIGCKKHDDAPLKDFSTHLEGKKCDQTEPDDTGGRVRSGIHERQNCLRPHPATQDPVERRGGSSPLNTRMEENQRQERRQT